MTLNYGGVLSALLLGAGLLAAGWLSGTGIFFLAVMLLFLAVSAVVTRMGRKTKKRMGQYELERGWRNVFANGVVPFYIILIYLVNNVAQLVPPRLLLVAYVASISAITADKFASEIGVLGGRPWMLLTLKKVKAGTSGAVSPLGLSASLIGALVISLTLYGMPGFPFLIAVATFSGFAGNLADSASGFYEEQGKGNKYTSNTICSAVGAALAFGVLLL
ncbi:MAG: DUF92 domain-containing protein [Candidatus Marsarchaeota archaeon]|nr:DUF92 domain-containing protein [Candidatus Marsarchaeota archaeon]